MICAIDGLRDVKPDGAEHEHEYGDRYADDREAHEKGGDGQGHCGRESQAAGLEHGQRVRERCVAQHGEQPEQEQTGQEQRAEPHDLAHVVTDRQIAVAALLAVDELRVDRTADDGTGSDLEVVVAVDVSRDVAADTGGRQQRELAREALDVAFDGTAHRHVGAETLDVGADAAVDVDLLAEREGVAHDLGRGVDADIAPEAVEIAADACPQQRHAAAAADDVAADGAFDVDGFAAGDQVARDVAAHRDAAAECQQVAVDVAVDGDRVTHREQGIVDRLAGRKRHEPSRATDLERVADRRQRDDDRKQRCCDCSERARAHRGNREPGDQRDDERGANQVERSSPHSSSLIDDERENTERAFVQLARFQWVEPLEAARDRRRNGVPEGFAEAADERDAEREHDEVARPRGRREAGNRRGILSVTQRQAQRSALLPQRFDAGAASSASSCVLLEECRVARC